MRKVSFDRVVVIFYINRQGEDEALLNFKHDYMRFRNRIIQMEALLGPILNIATNASRKIFP